MNTIGQWLRISLIALNAISTLADSATNQLPKWAETKGKPLGRVTSAMGSPMKSLTASLTPSSTDGPLLLQDTNFIEIMAAFDRERVPERVVHAKGAGAYGIFKVTHDITKYTKAALFRSIGQETEIFVRFSTVSFEAGSPDTVQADPRGFAIKFYTSEGNWDLVGNNLAIFPIRDPILFSSFVHTRKRNPQTHLFDKNMFWDFISLRPESAHHTIQLFSDIGIPDGYRHMNGFGVHAFKFVNATGEVHFVKFHHITQQGIKNLWWDDAVKLCGTDPDYATRDLFNAIADGNYPTWKTFIQVMTPTQAENLTGVFDPVQIWPEDKYPLIPYGEFVLNRNQKNFFAEVEQVAFDPGNLVPGIEMSPDRLLQGRSFSYSDSQRHRLGPNFLQIPINRPKTPVHNFHTRDGPMCMTAEEGPNYFPNSFGSGSKAELNFDQESRHQMCGIIDRVDNGPTGDNFLQASEFYRKMETSEKERLAYNFVQTLKSVHKPIRDRVLADVFAKISPELQESVAKLISDKATN